MGHKTRSVFDRYNMLNEYDLRETAGMMADSYAYNYLAETNFLASDSGIDCSITEVGKRNFKHSGGSEVEDKEFETQSRVH